MASITVKDLAKHIVIGADLFNDSENFMRDLSEDELNLQGGLGTPLSLIIITFVPD